MSAKRIQTYPHAFPSHGFYDNSFSPRTILLDALDNTMHAITGTTPVGRTVIFNTFGVVWVITCLATRVDVIPKQIGAMVLYYTRVCAVVWPWLCLQREHLTAFYNMQHWWILKADWLRAVLIQFNVNTETFPPFLYVNNMTEKIPCFDHTCVHDCLTTLFENFAFIISVFFSVYKSQKWPTPCWIFLTCSQFDGLCSSLVNLQFVFLPALLSRRHFQLQQLTLFNRASMSNTAKLTSVTSYLSFWS
jgi:hypothetical protein